mgnify:CR=1 FL=1
MEQTLYDSSGRPAAYIADDPYHSIYLWTGLAVAYIDHGCLYAWSGSHLGWFADGVLYDLQGLRVASVSAHCPVPTLAARAKDPKLPQRLRSPQHPTLPQPPFSSAYSSMAATDFLLSGSSAEA